MQVKQQGPEGLYSPAYEHDSCGVGFVAHIKGKRSHDIVSKGLRVLENMEHRGAEGADGITGDGAGILLQIPRDYYISLGIALPEEGEFATGLIFLSKDEKEASSYMKIFSTICAEEGLSIIAIRDVPVNNNILGPIAKSSEPNVKQVFVTSSFKRSRFELKVYIARRRAEIEMAKLGVPGDKFYMPSFSNRIIIYKGMLTAMQIEKYFIELSNPLFISALALVHSRFSTNTFPAWSLAQPFRMLAHNGEINTIKGNRFWMAARESVIKSDVFGDELDKVFPVIQPNGSDSASFDNVLEFFIMTGKKLPHVLSMMVPESWNDKNPISDELKAFYEYHSIFMEPWDGPASLIFSDGRFIGGTLDRNGLRPSRYVITDDDLIVMGSEVGVQVFPSEKILSKGRLRPGKIMMVDTEEGRIIYDEEIKRDLVTSKPYREWLNENRITLEDLKIGKSVPLSLGEMHNKYLYSFGYSREDIFNIILPTAEEGQEPVGSMGNDTPLAVMSKQPHRLFGFFKQLFAQVTNPAIDPIREELVMSLTGYVGSISGNILEEMPEHCKMIKFISPVITNKSLEVIKNLEYKGFKTVTLPMLFESGKGGPALEIAIEKLCKDAESVIDSGNHYIILSDRGINEKMAPIPSLIAVSAVHHHLIKKRKRMQAMLVVETAEAREVMHFALLFGYGASIINPYMVFSVIDKLVKTHKIQVDIEKAVNNYIYSINKGVLKVLSKIGTSTLRSYRGAQIFECVGLNQDIINKYFEGTDSRIEGMGINEIAKEAEQPHLYAFSHDLPADDTLAPNYGLYKYRREAESHAWSPEAIGLLQWATKTNNYEKYKEYTKYINDRKKVEPIFIRDFFKLKKGNAIPLNEVESIDSITKRFVTGAMSFGSISKEAHEALAIAMNKIGGKSNTGEGGEDPTRFTPDADGSLRRSAIKQVASGRFGVTTYYLVNADELQIKVCQGAKPGEGGQLPGYKVNQIIAKTRHSTPGITLISPPPHHDIYSIEDLKQLIFDLKNVNPKAQISVKLVSEAGVGTVAAGVAKAKADRIIISGGEGGTGASPSSSIRHAGLPMELGIAETHQTLLINNLRGKVVLQTDGQIKTGQDVVIAACLGAEEFGFATSALIVLGCIMMRKCHLNTCPVGVATQDEKLRERFHGRSEYVVNFFRFIAEDIREQMAALGIRTLNELVGRTDLIEVNKEVPNFKTDALDFSKLLYRPKEASINATYCKEAQKHDIDRVMDRQLIELSKPAIEKGQKVIINKTITNVDRTVGAMLSGVIATKHGELGLPDDSINSTFHGSAGQSFGAFLATGCTFRLEGDANDYTGKGLSGGKIIIYPPKGSRFQSHENIIIGNTVLYGATSGEFYASGMAGERFAVRNSGVTAVVEGVGDHGCEYMTGGRVVVLGRTGRNFAAGMSGGIAYVLNTDGHFDYFCNMGMVELSLVDEPEDIKELKELIVKHHNYTGSEIAKVILNRWDDFLTRFIKVIPYEYKKIQTEERLKKLEQKIEKLSHE